MALTTFADKGGQQVTAQALDSNFATLQNEVTSATQLAQAAASGQNWKAPAVAASTANINIASALINGAVVDGVTLATGNRVLLIAQTDATQNGIYVVAASGAASRSTDANTSALITGTLVFVAGGTANGNKQFALTTPAPISLGTTALTFTAVIDQGAVNASAVQPLVTEAQAAATAAEAAQAQIYTPINPDIAMFDIVDENGKVLAQADWTGLFEIFKLQLLSNTQWADGSLLSQHIFTSAIATYFQSLDAEGSGNWFQLTDENGKLFLALRSADNVFECTVTKALSASNALASFGARENSGYAVVPYYVSGIANIKSIRKSDGKVFLLTSSALTAAVDPFLTSDNFVTYFDQAANSPLYVPAEGGIAYPVEPSPNFACAGDSLTNGADGNGTNYPAVLAAASGRTATIIGKGGMTSTQIAALFGGLAVNVTVASNQIPASGPVAVTAYNINILYDSGINQGTQSGTLAGVRGVMSTDTSGNWTFTRSTAGSVTACPANSQFLPDLAVTAQFDTAILWIGRNDSGTPSTVMANIAACYAWLKVRYKRVLVMTVLNGLGEGTGTTAHTNITTIASDIMSTYPDAFDIRSWLISSGLGAASITPTTLDTLDIANDIPPASLHGILKQGALAANIGPSDTNFTINMSSGTLAVNDILDIAGLERIQILAVSGSTVTNCTRAYGGTTAASHNSGDAAILRDPIHQNAASYTAIGNKVWAQIQQRGW
jgi:hypothetical protein